MTWETVHPFARRLNPDDRPALVGSTWVRREPEGDGDPWDGPVRIVGIFEASEMLELCVQPVAFGEPVMTAEADSFSAAYRRKDEDDTGKRVSAQLAELEARVS